MSSSILIPASALETTMKRLSRLAKQAHVGLTVCPGVTYQYRKTRQFISKRCHISGLMVQKQVIRVDENVVLECARVTVGDLPRCNGHEFLGKIVHTEAGNMLQLAAHAQSEVIPEEWKTAKPTCDHCHTKRSRKDTFIIKTPEGKIQRVGRNCLADFLKVNPAEMVALAAFEDAWLEASKDDDGEEGGWGSSSGWGPSMWWYLCCCFSAVRRNGFVKSRPDSDEVIPTYSEALGLAMPFRGGGRNADHLKRLWEEGQPTEQDMADAIGAILWLDENTDDGNYIHNLKVGLQLRMVQRENMGLVASLPAAYSRAMGIIAAKKARPTDAGHWGEIKGRSSVEVTVLSVIHCEPGPFGANDLIKMVTDAGHELVTFTQSASAPSPRDVGRRFELRGTVKKHSSYQGRAQTELSRCEWTDINASDDQKEAVA